MASINVCIERPGAERFRDRPETILARGGRPLRGELRVQGAKNSTLPLLAAAVACRGETVLHNCPELSDVGVSVRILRRLGCRCVRRGHAWQGVALGARDRKQILSTFCGKFDLR